MKIFTLIFVLITGTIYAQNSTNRKGSIGLESGTFILENLAKGVHSSAGIQLDFDFNHSRFGTNLNFIIGKEDSQFFRRTVAPDFSLFYSYGIINARNWNFHTGIMGGLKTGIYDYSQNKNNTGIKTVNEMQSTSYIGPKLSFRKYIELKNRQHQHLSFTIETNYLIGLNSFSSYSENFESKINRDDAIFKKAIGLKVLLSWGTNMF